MIYFWCSYLNKKINNKECENCGINKVCKIKQIELEKEEIND